MNTEITIRLSNREELPRFRFSPNFKRPEEYYFEPAIIWLKKDQVVYVLFFANVADASKAFYELKERCGLPESLVGCVTVYFKHKEK
jgi:hypothetical protein